MNRSSTSALVTDNGRRVLLRLQGRFYQITQEELRIALGLPAGPAGLGITIDGDRLVFEFPGDDQVAEVSATQLQRRLAKKVIA
jgi:hypothetical protein